MRILHKLVLTWLLMLVSLLQANAEQERIFSAITASFGLADNSAQTIICTFTGRMTVTTIGNINFYDGSKFSHVETEQEDWYKLENYEGHYHLYYDNIHHLWLKGKHEVVCVDLLTETCISEMDSLFSLLGVNGRVDDVFIDVNGNVWMMHEGQMVSNKYEHKFPVIKELNLQDLEVYDKRLLFFSYNDGTLVCFDLKSGRQLYQNRSYSEELAAKYSRSGVQKNYKNGFYQIRNGEKGAILLHYDIDKQEWSEVMQSDYHLNNLAIYDDKLYIASEWGYFVYDLLTGEIVHNKSVQLRNGRRLETDINTIEFDRQGGMWMGTEKRGILYARPLNAPFRSLTWDDPLAMKYGAMMEPLESNISEFNGRKANILLVDSRKWTWVGSTTGLALYKTPHDKPIYYTRNSGLLNNVIHAIIEDDLHNVWVSTSYGITCFQVKDDNVRRVYSFNELDNVPNETFINSKAMKLDDGTIVMQALDHVVTFQPADFDSVFMQTPYVMYPKLTQLLVNGIDVQPGVPVNGSIILDRAITRTKEINLNYDQNSVTLTFSALNYSRPLQTHYRVRVIELGPEWTEYNYFNAGGIVDSRGLLHLPLNGLQPGDYHILLQSTVVPGEYIGEPYEWIIHVNQPWWRTTGVYAIAGLLLLAVLLANFFLFMRNTRLRERRKSNEGDVIKRIKSFVERCDALSSEPLSQSLEEKYSGQRGSRTDLSPEFIEAMMVILPYIHDTKGRGLTMQTLSNLTNIENVKLFEIMSANLYKSPRPLAMNIRLQQAAEMLRSTNKSVEEVATECGFATPNYFIASFYHKFRQTPKEYCEDLV